MEDAPCASQGVLPSVSRCESLDHYAVAVPVGCCPWALDVRRGQQPPQEAGQELLSRPLGQEAWRAGRPQGARRTAAG